MNYKTFFLFFLLFAFGLTKEILTMEKPSIDIFKAARIGDLAQLKTWLKDGGNDIDCANDDGWTPLASACHGGYSLFVKELLKHRAAINRADKNGFTPLHWACYAGHQPVVQLLLEHGANTECKNDYGRTAFHYAVLKKNIAIIQTLTEYGANIEMKDEDSRTPLDCAGEQNQEQVITAGKQSSEKGRLIKFEQHNNSSIQSLILINRK